MSSQHATLSNNVNDSKNTRLTVTDIAIGDARPDILAHLSRYNKIARLMIDESNRLKRPISVMDVGCGEVWPIRILYKAHVRKKSDVVREFTGIDIDDKMLARTRKNFSSILKIFNSILIEQDLTVNPKFPVSDSAIDFAYTTEVIEHMQPRFVPAWLDGLDKAMAPNGLIFISTPNSNGSNAKLPVDHIYEWGFEELQAELTSRWDLISATGTFIQLNNFNRANKEHGRIPEELVATFKQRFDHFWLRNVLAAPYPEVSNNVSWILRKR